METQAPRAIELRQVLGALLFGAREPMSLARLKKILRETGEEDGGAPFAEVREGDLRAGLEEIGRELSERRLGFGIFETAEGYRLRTDAGCGPWVRAMLEADKPQRLSRPTLETIAIIAYRQPITRAAIEAVRGVNVDSIVRNLMEMQLIKIVGRSELPGRPLLYGTTPLFLEHFGLKSVRELPGIEQLCRREAELAGTVPEPPAASGRESEPTVPAADQTAPPAPVAGSAEPAAESEGV